MDIQQYLERIGYAHPKGIGISQLRKLMECHVRNVPFEDLDIQAGIPIELDISKFYDKVVSRRRGGYCYELNGLFAALLKELGYRVDMLSARVANGKEYSPEFDHMALLVECDSQAWLVDVGFGDFSLCPLAIDNDKAQSDGRNNYTIGRLQVDNREYYSVARWNEGRELYVPQYIFSPTAHLLEDFATRNHYQQTNPESPFMKTLMCSLPTDDGRISMINNRMVYTENGQKRELAIRDEAHRQELLQSLFNIRMSASYKCAIA
ncbi:MAG: arylamine N-acetyltransferase [Bacteroidetes bacterium]|nr:arylamine N-acetyltransferase [Bacteroidota bacterium]